MKEDAITVVWEGKLKIEGVKENGDEILRFNTEEINIEQLENVLKAIKPEFRMSLIYAMIGALESIKLDLYCIELDDDEVKK